MTLAVIHAKAGTKAWVPAFALGDSHISLLRHSELFAEMDRMELLPAAPEGDRPRRLVVAVPSAQACDDPGRPCETSDGMVILLPLGAAFKRRAECRESVDLGFGECIG